MKNQHFYIMGKSPFSRAIFPVNHVSTHLDISWNGVKQTFPASARVYLMDLSAENLILVVYWFHFPLHSPKEKPIKFLNPPQYPSKNPKNMKTYTLLSLSLYMYIYIYMYIYALMYICIYIYIWKE